MTASLLELEGTWEEITAQMPEFNGQRLRVTVCPIENREEQGIDPLDQALETIWETVPDSSWEKLPTDFSENLDHYLHGTPKRK